MARWLEQHLTAGFVRAWFRGAAVMSAVLFVGIAMLPFYWWWSGDTPARFGGITFAMRSVALPLLCAVVSYVMCDAAGRAMVRLKVRVEQFYGRSA